jgi:hypothetical protein
MSVRPPTPPKTPSNTGYYVFLGFAAPLCLVACLVPVFALVSAFDPHTARTLLLPLILFIAVGAFAYLLACMGVALVRDTLKDLTSYAQRNPSPPRGPRDPKTGRPLT